MNAPQRGLPAVVTRLIAAAALTVALVTGAVAAAGVAAAHAARIAEDPAENSELTEAPARVSATFNEAMQAQFAAMTVIGPDGVGWSDGEPAVDGAMISVGVRPGAPAGDYTVNYRATSADGHVVSGSWSYRLLSAAGTAPAEPTTSSSPGLDAAPPASDTDADGLPIWPFVAGVTVLVAAGAVWAVRRNS